MPFDSARYRSRVPSPLARPLAPAVLVLVTVACGSDDTPAAPGEWDELVTRSEARAGPNTPLRIHFRITAEKMVADPTGVGAPGMVGDKLRVDVTGPNLGALSGTATFRNALGEERRLTITSSFITEGEIALADETCPPPIESEVITIILDGFQQGVPRVFVHECDATTISVFESAGGGERIDRVFLDLGVR